MLLLYVLGQHLEYLLGAVKYAVLYLTCGVIANIISYRIYLEGKQNIVAVGASGAIFAIMGALIWIIIRNKGRVRGLSLRQMVIMLVFSLYFGLISADVSNSAHISGLVAGFLSAIILYRKEDQED
jgi:rhomboid protease GluP